MTILLIDADILAYNAVASAEEEIAWDDDIWTIHSDLSKAKTHFNNKLDKLKEELGVTEYLCCFSDSHNFRKDVWPDYKTNRTSRKPVGYKAFKEMMLDEHPCKIKPSLEADDVMSILATKEPGKYIIVTADKDLKGTPGRLFKMDGSGDGELLNISEKEAYAFFLQQCLQGDQTDGVPGLKGFGEVKAKALLDKKGYVWKTVEQAYIAAGQTREDALVQSRMVRILQASDYDFKKDTYILWEPKD